ncbi:1-(5-phosphoribosyl)-5-[(5-phosphoribosylamino)methylideneamino]imidazole-4-carboxamide isomerase [Synechococcus sp. PCC 6312]|uniref:1-(5-phosphoribosyl)-5-[(5- phosphoribosylamino)methylideneamino]imidazole-4- carboxamide isomerase n=1 Tax=Synechococcus sp. (strain ATCC 27167 / PCC 6312) TaxID=195253 RepID=UPI00029EDCF4|nr:1-(5-phosphoribosyl)-5-[(5-phosphoribosylamino)methylideneamino]imidazole-4-carboxamide isomerase [Synechococcus sp. PCC 6312]AFY61039.1 1-(5-phosphoribosyl)-5-((5-phosphoribosylamino)methylideneamino) imidazole-4-carboxamide isomerase [Synechococcus sp. PCC 6312]
MDVIPAIDLLGGQCVRLFQGNYDQAQVFNTNPRQVAESFVSQGATRLHLVDLDGAKSGQPVNYDIIAEIAQTLPIPVQVGGGLRTKAQVQALLGLGVERAILGTVALKQPELVAELAAEFPGQIWVGIDAKNGRVATHGWLETSEITAIQLAQQMQRLGIGGIIYTDIARDGTLQGPNLDALKELADQVEVSIIASGGVSSLTDILDIFALTGRGIVGAIVGKAIYTGAVDLAEAIKAVGIGRWQDVPPDLGQVTWA